jgi:cytochrome b561/polyisoprenoid-binding protein YceI
MSASNTIRSYGNVARTFHWLVALLIFGLIPLGMIANRMAQQVADPATAVDEAFVAQTVLLFSLHKTLGVTLFLVALARILWALSQPKPRPLHPERRLETLAAEAAHWLLYGSLVLVPLTGWIGHAATTGFAPIWWPFGQSLPFVPKDDGLAETFASLHILFVRVLVVALLAHVAGALKHQIVDRDATLRRMLFAGDDALPTPPAHRRRRLPALAVALAVWAVALGIGAGLGMFAHRAPLAASATDLAEVAGGWTVQDGTLALTVRQFDTEVTGEFADWTAQITYDPDTPSMDKGAVTVTVDIGSLTLGSVTQQALGPDFLDRAAFPTAIFDAQIVQDDGLVARGALDLRGVRIAVDLPFTLTLEGDIARVTGRATLDRRRFGIGDSITDHATLGFEVALSVALTATRPAE